MQVVALPVGGALAAFFTYKVKFPSTLFSYHPTLLGLGWLAIVPYAMKYLRDSKVSALPPKKRRVWPRPAEVVVASVLLHNLRPCSLSRRCGRCGRFAPRRLMRGCWHAASIRREKRRPRQDPCAPQQVRRFAAARQTPNPCTRLPSTACSQAKCVRVCAN